MSKLFTKAVIAIIGGATAGIISLGFGIASILDGKNTIKTDTTQMDMIVMDITIEDMIELDIMQTD